MHQVNARGTFLVSKACLPHLLKAANPHVLMLSPPLDLQPKWFAAHTAYSMAKYGMSLCVLGMAAEFAGRDRVQRPVAAHRHRHGGGAQLSGGDEGHAPVPQARDRRRRRLCDFQQAAKSFSGNFLIDDTFLADEWRQRFRPVSRRSVPAAAGGFFCARRHAAAAWRDPGSERLIRLVALCRLPSLRGRRPGRHGRCAATGIGGPISASFKASRTTLLRSDCIGRRSRCCSARPAPSARLAVPRVVSTYTCGAGVSAPGFAPPWLPGSRLRAAATSASRSISTEKLVRRIGFAG